MNIQNTRTFFHVDYIEQTQFLERHVKWLKTLSDKDKAGAFALQIFETLALSLTIVGIPYVIKAYNIAKRIRQEEQYYSFAKEKRPPRKDETIVFKSDKRSFNHLNEYAIEDGILWYRKKPEFTREEWKPLYFDGFSEKREPVKIDADGANLIVIDDRQKIHYKKVLREYRISKANLKHDRHLKNIKATDLINCNYIAVDKSSKNNWKGSWFSLPVLHHIVNLFTGKRLTLPKKVKAVAISHQGKYMGVIEDRLGQKHPVNTGVTTLYVLDKEGEKIRKYDPWSPIWAKTLTYFPETKNSRFVAETISASASTIMVIGFEHDIKTKEKKLKILTKISDIDTEGGNPWLKYAFFKKSKARVLPIEPKWKEHPLPKGKLHCNITIFQTGEGNQSKELHVLGENPAGRRGCYYKKIDAIAWKFLPFQRDFVGKKDFSNALLSKSLLPKVRDYTGELMGFKGVTTVQLRNFGKHSNYAKITFQIDRREYKLKLLKRYTLLSFLGFNHRRFDLVIPEKYHRELVLQAVFGYQKATQVSVHSHKGQVIIQSEPFAKEPFTFCFRS